MKKAQGLPAKTIVILILALIVLAAVGIFFFDQFQTGKDSTKSQKDTSKNYTAKSQCQLFCIVAKQEAKSYSHTEIIGACTSGPLSSTEYCTEIPDKRNCKNPAKPEHVSCTVTSSDDQELTLG